MADGDDGNTPDVPGAQPDPGGGAPPAPPAAPAPPGGGPVLAALMKQRQGAPQVSAPGPGNQANAMMQIKSALDLITQALPSLGTDTPVYRSALNALRQLSRHVGQGGPTAGVQQTQLMDLLRKTVQNAMLQRVMQQQAGQQQQGAGQDQSAGPQPPMQAQPPTPSTPLPGA